MTSLSAKSPLATGRCSNNGSLSALGTEIQPGVSKGGLWGINASGSGKVSGLWGLRHDHHCGLMEKRRILAGVGPQGGRDVSEAVPVACPCQPACLGADAQHLALSRSSLFSAISNDGFFQTRLHGGENPAIPTVSAARLLRERLVPRSTRQLPAKSMVLLTGPISPDTK